MDPADGLPAGAQAVTGVPTWSEEDYRAYEVRPRYLAGSCGIGDPGFEPLPESWPRFDPAPDSAEHVVTSPDRRIHIGWDGDGLDELWRIGAYHGAVDSLAWLVTANHNTPPEIIGAFNEALVADYEGGEEVFLQRPHEGRLTSRGLRVGPVARPLLDAGWQPADSGRFPRTPGLVTLTSPDQLAVLRCHLGGRGPEGDRYELWAGPERRSRFQMTFSESVPDHLVAAVTRAVASPEPLVRERHMIGRDVEQHVTLTTVPATEPTAVAETTKTPKATPTPLDARRAAVTAAVQRAQGSNRFSHIALRRTTTVPRQRNPPPIPGPASVPPGARDRHR